MSSVSPEVLSLFEAWYCFLLLDPHSLVTGYNDANDTMPIITATSIIITTNFLFIDSYCFNCDNRKMIGILSIKT